MAVFVRGPKESDRATEVAQLAELGYRLIDDGGDPVPGLLSFGTMHAAKGLEFRRVIVMACDDEVIPSQERLSSLGDDADLQQVYETERHLLYVACTRAREALLVTAVKPGSEFLEDIHSS
jgi:superfamily I DNA/RNA helicase